MECETPRAYKTQLYFFFTSSSISRLNCILKCILLLSEASERKREGGREKLELLSACGYLKERMDTDERAHWHTMSQFCFCCCKTTTDKIQYFLILSTANKCFFNHICIVQKMI